MLCDFITKESTLEFLRNVLKCEDSILMDAIDNYWDMQTFLEEINIDLPLIDINSIEIKSFHITTSVDNCKSLNEKGLLSARGVFLQESSLSNFLNENGITIDLDGDDFYLCWEENQLKIETRADVEDFHLRLDIGKLHTSFNSDNYPWGFIHKDEQREYSCVLRVCEIIDTIERITKKPIVSKWEKLSRTYKMYFQCFLNEIYFIEDVRDNGETNENAFENLVKIAIKIVRNDAEYYCQYYPGIKPYDVELVK
ncbi:MAG: hypothetical protein ACK5L6_10130 [Anaerorhabdus sp.]|uniref:hypothetical protein n=1 Tax=Anaerorhabdus sp. TaxID=1872524 RepID=UPI003A8B4CAA